MSEQCDYLTGLSEDEIRAEMSPDSVLPELAQALKRVVSGSNVRGTRIDDLVNALGEKPDPLDHLEEVLKELEQIAIFDPSDKLASVPAPPSLLGLGLPQSDVERIATHLNADMWLELSLKTLNPKPTFFYRSKEDRYIVFRNASAGQQATALLHVLLNQLEPPLIIDQPEDDLDNEVIPKVVERIWQAKTRRQLIFTSHDANLVVNGDADLVVCCANRVAGDHSAGQIAHQRAIDMPDVREAITRVMEGGEAAFRLRTAKYGF
jgi:putative AbiEii toxin of type IV toxin-antitoxin system